MYSTGTVYVTSNTAYVATGSFRMSGWYSYGNGKSQEQKWREEQARNRQNKMLKEMTIVARKQELPNLPCV